MKVVTPQEHGKIHKDLRATALRQGLTELAEGKGITWDEVKEALGIPGSIKKPRGRPRQADPSPDALRHRKHYAKQRAERLKRQEERDG